MFAWWPESSWLNRLTGLTLFAAVIWMYFGPVGMSPFTIVVLCLLVITGCVGALAHLVQRRRYRRTGHPGSASSGNSETPSMRDR